MTVMNNQYSKWLDLYRKYYKNEISYHEYLKQKLIWQNEEDQIIFDNTDKLSNKELS